MRTGFRFSPPEVEAPAELAWVLVRAFADAAGPAADRPGDPARAARIAARLDLAARIGARHGGSLGEELGPAAGAFLEAHRVAAAGGLALVAVARQVAAVAASRGIASVFLKFHALEIAGVLAPGSRRASDLDLLVPLERLAELHAALLSSGYTESGFADQEHQEPPLLHPKGVTVELHRVVLGVRPGKSAGDAGSGPSATVEALAARGLLRAAEGFPDGCAVPAPEVVAAHAVVHALAQHGFVPGSYPLFRVVTDLADLDAAAGPVEALLDRARPLVARDVSRREVDGLARLTRRLLAADASLASELLGRRGVSDEALLLRHFLAGAFDPSYGRSLRLRAIADPLTDASGPAAAAAAVRAALAPTPKQLELLHGATAEDAGGALRRAARPVDLVVRLAGHVGRAARFRARRRVVIS